VIDLIIDGQEIKARPGMNVLEAALANGIDIPRLCYHPELSISGGCRLCLVEVEGRDFAVPSCGLSCEEGLVVRTQSDALTGLRRDIIDLFVSDHPLDCVTCDKAGDCQLQHYAYVYGITETSIASCAAVAPAFVARLLALMPSIWSAGASKPTSPPPSMVT